ncbi:MAG: SBBP repeat-containing protein [Candidatus Eisenbacteria bacterium]
MRSPRVLLLVLIFAITNNAFAQPNGFLRNEGQLDEKVLYYAMGNRGAVYLTADALVIDLKKPMTRPAPEHGIKEESRNLPPRAGCSVWVRFEGADGSGAVEATGELPGLHHYILGNDPSRWHSDVPWFEEVAYRDVRPGVDLLFRLENGGLRYRIRGAGGTEEIRFLYEGADRVVASEEGSVTVETGFGSLAEIRPAAAGGEGRIVWGNLDLRKTADSGERDNPSSMIWSTFISSPGGASGVVPDASGNIVLMGTTFDVGFPTTPGAYDSTIGGWMDLFVSKMDPTGSSLIWSTFLGGSGDEDMYGSHLLLLTPTGQVYVAGSTFSSDFPMLASSWDPTYGGAGDVFLARLGPSGSTLEASTYIGNTGGEWPYGIAQNAVGNIYVTGTTNSSLYPVYLGYDMTFNGVWDAFVTRLTGDLSTLVASTFLGGSDDEEGRDIQVGTDQRAVVTGYTLSTDFPMTPGAFDPTPGGVFMTKMNPGVGTLNYSTGLGPGTGEALALDAAGNAVVTGMAYDGFPTTPGAYDTTFNGGPRDLFAARLSADGSTLLWGTFVGGSDREGLSDVVVDATGTVTMCGYTESIDFPTTETGYDASHNGNRDAVITRLDGSGSSLQMEHVSRGRE